MILQKTEFEKNKIYVPVREWCVLTKNALDEDFD